MTPSSTFDPADVAKTLLRTTRNAALGTLMAGSGAPYTSLAAIASAPDGMPVLLISRLAVHTKNIEADARVSLLLAEEGAELTDARIMLSGSALRLEGTARDVAARRYLAAHPSAEVFAGFGDFGFFQVVPTGLHLVAGFGRIVDLAPERFVTRVDDAESLISAEADIVAHMNADHADTMGLYATRLLNADAGSWRCVAVDPEGLDIEAGKQRRRLRFTERISTPGALRVELKDLANLARQQTPPQNNRAASQ